MKKIPVIFEMEYENHKGRAINKIRSGFESVLENGTATLKYDGSACAIFNNELYKRYDAKNGKPIPDGAVKCQEEPDSITGHMPCWVRCDRNNPEDKWFFAAYDNTNHLEIENNKTYEAIGKHFNGNKYNMAKDILIHHGKRIIDDLPRTYEGIKEYLGSHDIEGIVFWYNDEPVAKIRRKDFGFKW